MQTAVPASVLALAITIHAITGCSAPRNTADAAPGALRVTAQDRCITSGVPLTALPLDGPDEPRLAIPTPSGWVFSTAHNSPLVRGAVLNPGLLANDFIPNAVVTLADVTADVSSADQAISSERDGLAQNVAITSDIPGTLCGYRSTTVGYTIAGRSASTLIVAGQDINNRVWVSTVGIQTTEPSNPDFISAKRAILEGFQFILKR